MTQSTHLELAFTAVKDGSCGDSVTSVDHDDDSSYGSR
jgi:hypothetical protein